MLPYLHLLSLLGHYAILSFDELARLTLFDPLEVKF
jgi:hypothetical protein